MGDEEIGQAELALQILEQVQHAGLDADVERGDRLVQHHHLGPDGERAGDADALALAAGEFMGIAAGMLGRELHQAQQLGHPGLGLGAR